MAENEAEVTEATEEVADSGGNKRAMVVGIISLVVVLETLVFFLFVPSADEVAALAESRLLEAVERDKEEEIKKEDEENKVIEQALGMFGETFSPIGTERQYRIEFRIFATLRERNKEPMETEFQGKEGRFRHSIRNVIRNAKLEELNENQLGLIERRILATCNNLLEEPFLLSVGFGDYQLRPE